MGQKRTTKCYIEQLGIDPSRPAARLKEKHTGRKVDLGSTSSKDDIDHFGMFLGAALAHREAMPELFSKDNDEDCVAVTGELDFDSPDEVRYLFNDELTYGFE